jgi:hypothetical protein
MGDETEIESSFHIACRMYSTCHTCVSPTFLELIDLFMCMELTEFFLGVALLL